MKNFIRFIAEVWGHWATAVSGGTLAALPYLIEHNPNHPVSVPNWGYSLSMVIGLLIAVYSPWKDQLKIAEERKQKIDELQAKLDAKSLSKAELKDALNKLASEGEGIVKLWKKTPDIAPLNLINQWFAKSDTFCKKHLEFDDYEHFKTHQLDVASMICKSLAVFGNNSLSTENHQTLRHLFSRIEALYGAVPKPTPRRSEIFRGNSGRL